MYPVTLTRIRGSDVSGQLGCQDLCYFLIPQVFFTENFLSYAHFKLIALWDAPGAELNAVRSFLADVTAGALAEVLCFSLYASLRCKYEALSSAASEPTYSELGRISERQNQLFRFNGSYAWLYYAL